MFLWYKRHAKYKCESVILLTKPRYKNYKINQNYMRKEQPINLRHNDK